MTNDHLLDYQETSEFSMILQVMISWNNVKSNIIS